MQLETKISSKSDGDEDDSSSVWSSPRIRELTQPAKNPYIELSDGHTSEDDHEETSAPTATTPASHATRGDYASHSLSNDDLWHIPRLPNISAGMEIERK
ncbi:uncharacterized protein PHALS_14348 [Plasmopara halstedii]|uniref:Uncharacterized protein n=1 Tax=Plasmopara halstedii TaxID=4781 RepID=A0A0P1AR77_PLAHL|nr:uncharacterized protein PHALS_14348 [Plasmopara halstedii]CEG44080.1 hypothetical protein PHALS_14348 [Plasmopara halstedii]|eukprot:XP_024580449.1 hypothetical protein PHALS_14348 [Plasmopara halstedii]